MKRSGLWFVSAALCLLATTASAKDVVIVTSFPKELFETYKKAFELRNPGAAHMVCLAGFLSELGAYKIKRHFERV